MVYIKKLSDDRVQLGGMVATDQMKADGWFEYDGPIPEGDHFKFLKGVLINHAPEMSLVRQIETHKEYLNNTDFKMLPDYKPKEGEDIKLIKKKRDMSRKFIRDNESKVV